MSELLNQLSNIDTSESIGKQQIVKEINDSIKSSHYKMLELDDLRPWGAFFRLDNGDADTFIEEFFPGVKPAEARLGNENSELSPKILLVSPSQRLSWQYHNRRAECWSFLTEGAYKRSMTDNEEELQIAHTGDVVQFVATERHRLVGRVAAYTLVAEIWQHTDSNNSSSEDDIVRLQDDYSRS